jgi:hypothetical protein
VDGAIKETNGLTAGAGVMLAPTVRRFNCVAAVSVSGAGPVKKLVALEGRATSTGCPQDRSRRPKTKHRKRVTVRLGEKMSEPRLTKEIVEAALRSFEDRGVT